MSQLGSQFGLQQYFFLVFDFHIKDVVTELRSAIVNGATLRLINLLSPVEVAMDLAVARFLAKQWIYRNATDFDPGIFSMAAEMQWLFSILHSNADLSSVFFTLLYSIPGWCVAVVFSLICLCKES